MKGIDIFNIKAISLKVSKPKVLGVYHRIYNATKGNTSGLNVLLIDEIIKVVEDDSKSFLYALRALKLGLDNKSSKPKKRTIKKVA